MAELRVSSKAFDNNGQLPVQYTGFGEDISPELNIEGISEDAVSLAVVMDDLDFPFLKEYCHWTIWNIPVTNRIPEGIPHGSIIDAPRGAVQGDAYGKHGYRGPKQPFFIKKSHRYRFTVYALDCFLRISPESTKEELFEAMDGHFLQSGEITVNYDPTLQFASLKTAV